MATLTYTISHSCLLSRILHDYPRVSTCIYTTRLLTMMLIPGIYTMCMLKTFPTHWPPVVVVLLVLAGGRRDWRPTSCPSLPPAHPLMAVPSPPCLVDPETVCGDREVNGMIAFGQEEQAIVYSTYTYTHVIHYIIHYKHTSIISSTQSPWPFCILDTSPLSLFTLTTSPILYTPTSTYWSIQIMHTKEEVEAYYDIVHTYHIVSLAFSTT